MKVSFTGMGFRHNEFQRVLLAFQGSLRAERRACHTGSPMTGSLFGWGMSLQAFREHPWRLMIAVNAAVFLGVLLHKIALPPYVPYIHLLVDYHFGFVRRALIGAIVALFSQKVRVWLVCALGGA